jgi:hypothetical protein
LLARRALEAELSFYVAALGLMPGKPDQVPVTKLSGQGGSSFLPSSGSGVSAAIICASTA